MFFVVSRELTYATLDVRHSALVMNLQAIPGFHLGTKREDGQHEIMFSFMKDHASAKYYVSEATANALTAYVAQKFIG